MSYKTEFPDYDGEFFLPKGWEDNSWHNDVCPHAEKRDENLGVSVYLWQDYVNPENREYEEGKRYIYEIRLDKSFNYIFSFATDDLELIKEMVNSTHIPGPVPDTTRWKTYEVSYVDGNDMRYKVQDIKAENAEKARATIFEGNAFEHIVLNVKEV